MKRIFTKKELDNIINKVADFLQNRHTKNALKNAKVYIVNDTIVIELEESITYKEVSIRNLTIRV